MQPLGGQAGPISPCDDRAAPLLGLISGLEPESPCFSDSGPERYQNVIEDVKEYPPCDSVMLGARGSAGETDAHTHSSGGDALGRNPADGLGWRQGLGTGAVNAQALSRESLWREKRRIPAVQGAGVEEKGGVGGLLQKIWAWWAGGRPGTREQSCWEEGGPVLWEEDEEQSSGRKDLELGGERGGRSWSVHHGDRCSRQALPRGCPFSFSPHGGCCDLTGEESESPRQVIFPRPCSSRKFKCDLRPATRKFKCDLRPATPKHCRRQLQVALQGGVPGVLCELESEADSSEGEKLAGLAAGDVLCCACAGLRTSQAGRPCREWCPQRPRFSAAAPGSLQQGNLWSSGSGGGLGGQVCCVAAAES
nr:uncharacterized protein LOC129039152 [Pongo pygmaeus]